MHIQIQLIYLRTNPRAVLLSHASWKVSCEVLPFCSATVSNHSDGFLGKLFFSIKGMAGVSKSINPNQEVRTRKPAERH